MPTRRPAPLLAVLALAAATTGASGCAARRIPGTDIPDTSDTQAILGVLREYRAASEARDAGRILALASPAFRDDAGTPTPEDDLDYERLQQVLPRLLQATPELKLDVSVRRIDVQGETARAVFYFTNTYKLAAGSGAARPRSDSDLKEMQLRREDGAWKVLSGL
jgi:hypothetical protein